MSQNYFQMSESNPYHISIGAVVRSAEGKICAHYFTSIFDKHSGKTIEDLYLLMRETIEPNESIEICLARGLMEEFGMEARLVRYLGSIVSDIPLNGVMVEKTTLYFLCDLISYDERRRSPEDLERNSTMLWLAPEDLIRKMESQYERLPRKDANEAVIIKRMSQ